MLARMPTSSSRSTPLRGRPSKKTASRTDTQAPAEHSPDADQRLDTRYLESLLGYNARRAALAVISVFLRRMAPYGLRPVDFSVLTLIAHNPGITSRQICTALDILPPNLVGMIKALQTRKLIVRKPHPTDRRAQGLELTAAGKRLQASAQTEATALEADVASALSPSELLTLHELLRKVYLHTPAPDIGSDPG
jgi:DNA-binding MarR family transcriptional regulator